MPKLPHSVPTNLADDSGSNSVVSVQEHIENLVEPLMAPFIVAGYLAVVMVLKLVNRTQ